MVDELNRTRNPEKREKLLGVIPQFGLELLEVEQHEPEIERLVALYLQNGIVPAKKTEDALHIAIATVTDMDVLLSWNYRHLSNVRVESRVQAIDLLEGYEGPLRMTTPLEMIYENE